MLRQNVPATQKKRICFNKATDSQKMLFLIKQVLHVLSRRNTIRDAELYKICHNLTKILYFLFVTCLRVRCMHQLRSDCYILFIVSGESRLGVCGGSQIGGRH